MGIKVQNSCSNNLTDRYFQSIGQPKEELNSFYFCDNEKDANECAELVLNDVKRASASCLWSYELEQEPLPAVDDISIVTDWSGNEKCIIKVERVEITPYNEITEEFARTEGEGDKSLKYWKEVHWEFYSRELAGSKYEPEENMLIVCEYFRVIFR